MTDEEGRGEEESEEDWIVVVCERGKAGKITIVSECDGEACGGGLRLSFV